MSDLDKNSIAYKILMDFINQTTGGVLFMQIPQGCGKTRFARSIDGAYLPKEQSDAKEYLTKSEVIIYDDILPSDDIFNDEIEIHPRGRDSFMFNNRKTKHLVLLNKIPEKYYESSAPCLRTETLLKGEE